MTAIRSVYAAFADVPRPAAIHGCPCCTSASDTCRLTSGPIAQIAAEDLERLAFKGITTLGTAADFHAFVPRLLELLAADALDVLLEIVAGKLAMSGPWTKAQRAAVAALWEEQLAARLADDGDADAWICGAALAGLLPSARLAAVLDRPGVAAGLDAWWTDHGLRNAFWTAPQARALTAWMELPRVRDALALPHVAGADGVIAEERCLYTCRVLPDGHLELDVEFEVHPGGSSSVRARLDDAVALDPAALHALAWQIADDPAAWR